MKEYLKRTVKGDLTDVGFEGCEEAVAGYELGYLRALTDFAIWKDGDQLTAMGRNVKPIIVDMKAVSQELQEMIVKDGNFNE